MATGIHNNAIYPNTHAERFTIAGQARGRHGARGAWLGQWQWLWRGGERGGWQGQEQGLSPASANKRTGQNCACNQFQVCAARGLFEKAIPLPHSPNLRPVSTSLSSPQSPLPTNRQRRLSSEKYATLSSWTRLCCCCFISPLPCLPSHTAHRDSDAGRFGHVKSRWIDWQIQLAGLSEIINDASCTVNKVQLVYGSMDHVFFD